MEKKLACGVKGGFTLHGAPFGMVSRAVALGESRATQSGK